MADPRLFFQAPDGDDGTQVSVQSIGQGATRQVATFIQASDVVGGGSGLPDGTFVGQLLYWDGAAWVPVPPGIIPRSDGFTTVDPSNSSLLLNFGSAALVGDRAQLNDILAQAVVYTQSDGYSSSWSDGVDTTLELGNASGWELTTGGYFKVNVLACNQVMQGSAWQVSLGEGGDYVALDLVTGFSVLVEPGLDITLTNVHGCSYSMQPEIMVFRTPDSVGVPTNNFQLSHDGDNPAMGCLGAGPSVRQVVDGATTQDQLDSLIAALVLFGLITDSRTNNLQSQIGWAPTVAGNQSNVLTLMPAGHAPGLYRVCISQFVRTVSASGAGTEVLTWSDGGAQSATTGATSANTPRWSALGQAFSVPGATQFVQLPRFIYSDGVSAITYQVTATGTLVAPIIDIFASAQR